MSAQARSSRAQRAQVVIRRRAGTLTRAIQVALQRGGWLAAAREGAHLAGELISRPAHRWYEQRLERTWTLDTRTDTGVPHATPLASFDDAVGYSPIPIHHFRRLLRRLPLDTPQDYTFVDLGCGKGRTLVLAARHGFRHVIGVELDTRLSDIARTNAAAAPTADTDVTVHNLDAATYDWPATPTVIFLFNPFGADTLNAVVTNVVKSLDAAPRQVVIAYFNPVHDEVLETYPTLRRTAHARHWTIYESVI
ncbi:class I SAM-dependent methyltransferase [Actinoplanes solisilvae]|uniref:class I SAM-dependent methyltransferase n=1 Tax=Actinoplanes solisilvae TaxID=2486853 RepID=UPI000FD9D63B|nr:class I SAM-dependent methyltransferase [Actinoplanes solisilvae]